MKASTAALLTKSLEYTLSFPKSVCTCGHTGDGANSYHADRLLVVGHGYCTHREGTGAVCKCQKFAWAGWTEHFKAFLKKAKAEAK